MVASEEVIIKVLKQKYPNQKFSIYDYKHENTVYSMPLSLLLRSQNKLDTKGIKIGVNCYGKECPGKRFTILTKPVRIVDLRSVNQAKLNHKLGLWVNVNASSVYDDQVGWLNKDQLKSTFSLKNYIIDKARF
jgi:hypothetical protein